MSKRKGITIKELKALCEKEIKKGNGSYEIFLSDDDEGNGFHKMFFGFTPISKMVRGTPYDDETLSLSNKELKGKLIVLG